MVQKGLRDVFPPILRNRLVYTDIKIATTVAGALYTQQYYGNALYDVDYTGGGG